MSARKPKARKPVPRKRSAPTLEQRVAKLERLAHPPVYNHVPEILGRIEALETRAQVRDASHDEPVSNAGEAVGQHFTLIAELPRAPWWQRFWNFMGAP
jgi:hypothetical protein